MKEPRKCHYFCASILSISAEHHRLKILLLIITIKVCYYTKIYLIETEVAVRNHKMDRAEFTRLMVLELEKKTSSVGLNAVADEDIATISRKFDFDYPVLSADNMKSLTSALETEGSRFPLRLNTKFVDNLNYIAQSKLASDDKAFAKATSSFITSIFLSQPERMFQMNQASLSAIFKRRDFEAEVTENLVFSNTSKSSTELLSWDEIFSEFFSFLLKGSASLICGVVTDDTVGVLPTLQKVSTYTLCVKVSDVVGSCFL